MCQEVKGDHINKRKEQCKNLEEYLCKPLNSSLCFRNWKSLNLWKAVFVLVIGSPWQYLSETLGVNAEEFVSKIRGVYGANQRLMGDSEQVVGFHLLCGKIFCPSLNWYNNN